MFDFLSQKFSEIVSKITGSGRLTEANISQALEQVREALIDADVPYSLTHTFVDSVKQDALGKKVLASVKPGEQFVKIVHNKLLEFMGGQGSGQFSFQMPSTVLVMGLQGSGKTSSTAKMVRWVQKEAEKKGKTRRILVASVDYYRPAAIDQLEVLAGTVKATFYRAVSSDPIQATKEILDQFKKGCYELLFLDTAGRLHMDERMLQELKEIEQIAKPRHKILVLDAMTGQESLTVAKAFDEQVGFHAALLTKLDSDTRGGAAFAFRYMLKKPILFVGTGEKIDDLDLFRADRAAGRILGMGDVLSLVEKAEEQVKESDKQALEKAMRTGTLTLDDFASQMNMVQNMGSISSLLKYMPGMRSIKLTPEMTERAEREMKQFKAAVASMTKKERKNPQVIDASRRKRISQGAGVSVESIGLLLQRFEESKQFVKLFKKFGKF